MGSANQTVADNDYEVTYHPYADLPVIVWDKERRHRKIVPMRWGLPDPKNYKTLKHIHAHAETIDTTKAFASLFRDRRRGIVVMKTFNETPPDSSEQWTINPQDGRPRGFAFLCQGYKVANAPDLRACVMVTVRANKLLTDTILKTDPDPRMPAILDQDWATWLGENDAPIDEVKSVLKTMDGEGWTIAPEPTTVKPPKPSAKKSKQIRRRTKRHFLASGWVRQKSRSDVSEVCFNPLLIDAKTRYSNETESGDYIMAGQTVTVDVVGGPLMTVDWIDGMSAQDALEGARDAVGEPEKFDFALQYFGADLGYMVVMINGTWESFQPKSDPNFYWDVLINDERASKGIDQENLKAGDKLTFRFDEYIRDQHAGSLLQKKHESRSL